MPYLVPRRLANPAPSVGVVAGLATTRRRSQATSEMHFGCVSVASASGCSIARPGVQVTGDRCPEPLTKRICARPLYCLRYSKHQRLNCEIWRKLWRSETALFYLSPRSYVAECLDDKPLCSVVRSAARECHANAARLEREIGEV